MHPDHSLAIAYRLKRKAKKMAEGGMVDNDLDDTPVDPQASKDMADAMKHAFHKKGYADGGMVDRIMEMRHPKDPDEDLDHLADFSPNEFNEQEIDPPSTEDADYTGANAGDEISDEGEEERRRDVVARVLHSRSKRDRMPRPA